MSNHETGEDQDPVWELLRRARPAPEAPRLSEHVLRSIRGRPEPAIPPASLLWRAILPAAGAAAAALLLLLASQPPHSAPSALAQSSLPFEQVADFEALVAGSAGWAWSEVAP